MQVCDGRNALGINGRKTKGGTPDMKVQHSERASVRRSRKGMAMSRKRKLKLDIPQTSCTQS
jgi:hypothetical protein